MDRDTEITFEATLRAILTKALDGGFKVTITTNKSGEDRIMDEFEYAQKDNQKHMDLLVGNFIHNPVFVFDHDFTKAFWGGEETEGPLWKIFNPPVEGEPVTYVGTYVLRWGKENEPTVAFAPAELPAWQYHLQQMVLEENPIEYLKKFL